jgi:hypothetical protein
VFRLLDCAIIKYSKEKKKLNVFGVESKAACIWLGATEQTEQEWIDAIDGAMETTDNAVAAQKRLAAMFADAAQRESESSSNMRLKSGTMLIQRRDEFMPPEASDTERAPRATRKPTRLRSAALVAGALAAPGLTAAAALAKPVPQLPSSTAASAAAAASKPVPKLPPKASAGGDAARQALDKVMEHADRLCTTRGQGSLRQRAAVARELVLAQKELRVAVDRLGVEAATGAVQRGVVAVVTHMKQALNDAAADDLSDADAVAMFAPHYAALAAAAASLRTAIVK